MNSSAVQFIQSLRGSQPLVVLAYLITRRSMTIAELEDVIGIDNDTVRKAVKNLETKGLLFKQGERGQVVWSPVGDTFFGIAPMDYENSSPKFSGSNALLSSSSNTNHLLSTIEEEEEEEFESEVFGLNLVACDEMGIREPKRRLIAGLPHVTPEKIRAHCAQAKADGYELGTAIHRIVYDWSIDNRFLTVSTPRGNESVTAPKFYDDGRRGTIIRTYTFDLDKDVADFMGHAYGCKCSDCRFIRAMDGDTRLMCPDCKHRVCECEEE